MNAKCIGLVCRDCGTRIAESEFSLACPKCGAPMRVIFDPESLKEALDKVYAAAEKAELYYEVYKDIKDSGENLQ